MEMKKNKKELLAKFIMLKLTNKLRMSNYKINGHTYKVYYEPEEYSIWKNNVDVFYEDDIGFVYHKYMSKCIDATNQHLIWSPKDGS